MRRPWAVLVCLAVCLIALNAYAASDADRVGAALGAILLTNIGLILATVFAAGTSIQRLRALEKWREEHEEWADKQVAAVRSEAASMAGDARATEDERHLAIDRRMSELARQDVFLEKLNSIIQRLQRIEEQGKS